MESREGITEASLTLQKRGCVEPSTFGSVGLVERLLTTVLGLSFTPVLLVYLLICLLCKYSMFASTFLNYFISSLYLLFCHPLQGEGTLLATGSYDGQARIWSRDGE
jgi:hypothetical protein